VHAVAVLHRAARDRTRGQGVPLRSRSYLATLLDLAALAALNYDHFHYAEQLYDKFVAPLYRDNQTLIQKYTEQIEKLFDKNSEALKSKVASSAGESKCCPT
jgi:hypothetical protein